MLWVSEAGLCSALTFEQRGIARKVSSAFLPTSGRELHTDLIRKPAKPSGLRMSGFPLKVTTPET
jgi:hypothetical protein